LINQFDIGFQCRRLATDLLLLGVPHSLKELGRSLCVPMHLPELLIPRTGRDATADPLEGGLRGKYPSRAMEERLHGGVSIGIVPNDRDPFVENLAEQGSVWPLAREPRKHNVPDHLSSRAF